MRLTTGNIPTSRKTGDKQQGPRRQSSNLLTSGFMCGLVPENNVAHKPNSSSKPFQMHVSACTYVRCWVLWSIVAASSVWLTGMTRASRRQQKPTMYADSTKKIQRKLARKSVMCGAAHHLIATKRRTSHFMPRNNCLMSLLKTNQFFQKL